MNNTPFTVAAIEWIKLKGKTVKVTKHMKKAVLDFGSWMDELIRKQEMAERMKNGREKN